MGQNYGFGRRFRLLSEVETENFALNKKFFSQKQLFSTRKNSTN
jgi:hypothetical protein